MSCNRTASHEYLIVLTLSLNNPAQEHSKESGWVVLACLGFKKQFCGNCGFSAAQKGEEGLGWYRWVTEHLARLPSYLLQMDRLPKNLFDFSCQIKQETDAAKV